MIAVRLPPLFIHARLHEWGKMPAVVGYNFVEYLAEHLGVERVHQTQDAQATHLFCYDAEVPTEQDAVVLKLSLDF